MESTLHQTPPSLHLHKAHHEKTDRIASVFSALIHHNEKFCDWKFRRSVRKTKQHNEPPCLLYRVIILQNFPETKLYSCSSVPLKSNSIYTEYWVKQINSRANYAIILHKGWQFCLQTWLLMRYLCLRRHHKKRKNYISSCRHGWHTQSLVRLTDEGAKVTHTWERHEVIMHMTAVISCNKMWNGHTYLLQTRGKAGQHDYIVFLSNGY